MKDFFERHGLWLLLVAVLVTVTMAVLSVFGSGIASPIKNAIGAVTAPVRSGMAAAAEWVDDRFRSAEDFKALEEENETLRRQLAKAETEIRQAEADRAENEKLRDLLNLPAQQRNFQCETAHVVDHTQSNWTRTLTLNKGSSAGLAPKDCVITSTGDLVGVISEVGTNWATVLTTVDTDFEMGATVFRSGESAIASGDFNLMAEGQLRLNYLPADGTLLNGDLVISSGLGGYFPPSLGIGTVDEIVTDDSGATDYALLVPSVDFDSLTEVFVITDFTIVD